MKTVTAAIILIALAGAVWADVDPLPAWTVTTPAIQPLPPWAVVTPDLAVLAAAPIVVPNIGAVTDAVTETPCLTGEAPAATETPSLTGEAPAVTETPSLTGATPATTETPSLTGVLTPGFVMPYLEGTAVTDGGVEQQAMLNGLLSVSTAPIVPPAVPAWLDGWYWRGWGGPAPAPAPAPPADKMPVVIYPATPPVGPHLVAVSADATTPLTPLAEYLVADVNVAAVIVSWEETDHSYQSDAALDPGRTRAVAMTVRASRPGLPVWLLCSATVTGNAAQAVAKVAAVSPDALVVYGYFAAPAWEPAALAANLARAQALLPGKPVYAAGLRFYGVAREQALLRAQQAGWSGALREVR